MAQSETNDSEEEKECVCDICGKHLANNTNLKMHIEKHEVEKKLNKEYKCKSCCKVFYDKFCLAMHREKEHPKPNNTLKCNICNKMLKGGYAHLKEHKEKVHSVKRKTYECKICGDKLKSEDCLNGHLESHKKQKLDEPEKCIYCDDQFEDLWVLRNHLFRSHGEFIIKKEEPAHLSEFRCPECDYVQKIKKLRVHYKQKHLGQTIESFKCRYCFIQFYDHSEKRAHEKKHINDDGDINFNCHECPEKFEGAEAFVAHYNEHYASRPHGCSYCSRRFTNAYLCMTHESKTHFVKSANEVSNGLTERERRTIENNGWMEMLPHGPERCDKDKLAFVCKECGKKVYGITYFREHLGTHKEKDFACELCDYTATRQYILDKHMQHKHNGTRNFQCNICEQSFKTKPCLFTHEKVHQLKKECKCQDCGKEFQDEYTYLYHVRTVHGGNNKCFYCDLNFLNKELRREHVNSSHSEKLNYKCMLCGDGFRSTPSLDAHMKTHEYKKQNCIICNEEFKNEHSLIVHAKAQHDGRRFKCETCGNMHRSLATLKEHMRATHKKKQQQVKQELPENVLVMENTNVTDSSSNSVIDGETQKHIATYDTENDDKSIIDRNRKVTVENETANVHSNTKQTNLPMAVAVYDELVANETSCCIVWLKTSIKVKLSSGDEKIINVISFGEQTIVDHEFTSFAKLDEIIRKSVKTDNIAHFVRQSNKRHTELLQHNSKTKIIVSNCIH